MSTNWDWPGAKWWKFDFHSHTPASDDYGKGPNQAELKQISHTDWLINYMRQGVDCVAVTDHNSGAWIDPLKQALRKMENDSHPEYRPLWLFPGVEISVQGNIHILAIFAPDKATSDIDSLIGAVGYRATRGKSDGCTERSAVEVINEIAKAGGLAIPAHVDQPSGLFIEYNRNTLDQVCKDPHVFAMELGDINYRTSNSYSARCNWAEVLGSDSHHPSGKDGLHYPGSHFTWVKMSKPSYDGLRLALTDGNLSLKRSDSFTGDPNSYGSLVIESITVDNAKYLGMGKSFVCQLNPWLNTIIGGRGTGKSTLLEFLRIALKRLEEIPHTLKNDFVKYSKIPESRQDEGLIKKDTKITVIFRKDGSRFKIICSKTDDKYTIEEETAPGNWIASDGDIAQRFPVRIYSQKQIFEIAKHPQALLHVIDDTPAVNRQEWQHDWDQLLLSYLSICTQMRKVQAELWDEWLIKRLLEDVNRKLSIFEKADYANVLKIYQLRQNQNKAIDSWEKAWELSANQVQAVSSNLLPPELDSQHFNNTNADDKQLLDMVEMVRTEFKKLQEEMNSIAQHIDKIKNAWSQFRPKLNISNQIIKANDQYACLDEQLRKVRSGDTQTYDALVKQRQDLEEKLKSGSKKRETLDQYQKDAEECLKKIYEHRVRLTERRKAFLNNTIAGNSYVQIKVIPFGDKTMIESDLRNLIGCGNAGFDRDIGVSDGDDGLLAILNQKSSQTMEENIEKLKSALGAIHAQEPAAVEATRDRRFASRVQGLTPEQMDRIRCWFPEDSLDVKYSFKDGGSFTPLGQGSPGQKTAALLAFIFSYGNEPLVLDQPEDDLDNQLIYNLIVAQLRNIKQERQVLIVSHNANIVVNGDAENIIALDVKAGQTKIVAQGGLQESSIRDEICRVMEGGKEAFDRRYKRINAGVQ